MNDPMNGGMSDDQWRGYVRATLEAGRDDFREIKDRLESIEERQRRVEIASAKTAGTVAVIVTALMLGIEWLLGGKK